MRDLNLSGWHRLTEQWVTSETEGEFSSTIKRVTEAVRDLGFDPVQVERIQTAIMNAISDKKRSVNENPDSLAVLIRLWIPDVDKAAPSQTKLKNQPVLKRESSRLGFFLIEKTVGDQKNPWKVSCQMVDVLIY